MTNMTNILAYNKQERFEDFKQINNTIYMILFNLSTKLKQIGTCIGDLSNPQDLKCLFPNTIENIDSFLKNYDSFVKTEVNSVARGLANQHRESKQVQVQEPETEPVQELEPVPELEPE